jgi:hypothetical protein
MVEEEEKKKKKMMMMMKYNKIQRGMSITGQAREEGISCTFVLVFSHTVVCCQVEVSARS